MRLILRFITHKFSPQNIYPLNFGVVELNHDAEKYLQMKLNPALLVLSLDQVELILALSPSSRLLDFWFMQVLPNE